MKTISQMFDSAFATMEARGWEKIYVLVDIHETILHPTWSEERSNQYYPGALACLRLLTTMDNVCAIQWSSSSPENNKIYHRNFMDDCIYFDYINCNPEIESTDYADFDSKPYMNVILDDKAGFDANVDWLELHEYLINKK